MTTIKSVTLTEFTFSVPDIGLENAAAGVGNMAYVAGATFEPKRFAVRLTTDDGGEGAYVTHWVGTPAAFAQATRHFVAILQHQADQRPGLRRRRSRD